MAELLAELKSQCTTLVVSHRPGILAHARGKWDLNELKAQEMMDEPYEWEKDWERVCGVLDFRVDSEVTLLKI